ncbi:MAG: type II secretion system F family protein [Candidatus Kerfeldbacteria bacterium]|nr:type II secretion system F family protein [Candidatus Kerfeldbacteria bacterium]
MSFFVYIAKNHLGQTTKGTVEAATIEAAGEALREQQLIVLSLNERSAQSAIESIERLINRVGTKEITFFARQLAVLMSATIPVVRALKILIRQSTNPRLQAVIAEIAADVDGGMKLSQAMGRHPTVFNQFFVHMIRAGETTGRLDQVLEYLADQEEKDYILRNRIRGAMVYPIFIFATMIGVGTTMMIYVIPRLATIITQSGAELPWPTKVLLGTSAFLQQWWLVLLIAIIGVSVGLYFYIHTLAGRWYFDWIKIHIPIIGPLYQRIALTRFAVSFSNLLLSAVPVTKALEIVGDVVNNAVYHNLIEQTIIEVENGNAIASVFIRSKDIPPLVSQMLSVGEETGKIDEILKKMGAFYSQQVETGIATLTSLIEPIIILLLGIAAAIMVTGILLPIYSITESIG